MAFLRTRKGFAATAVAATLALALSACGGDSADTGEADSGADSAETEAADTETEGEADAADGDLGTINVGALAVPAGDMLLWLNENLAADAGLQIEFTEFTDYNTPNPSLTEGSTDANLFQNTTFMENYNQNAGEDLVAVAEIYLPAGAFYSNDYDSFDEVPDGADIAIPNDPTNGGRALKILAAAGIIGITDEPISADDVTDNPRGFNFIEIENASLPRAVDDTDVAFVTSAFALPANLSRDLAILVEDTDSDYYNALVVRSESIDDPRVVKLAELLQADEFKDWVWEEWGGLIIPVDYSE